MFTNNKQFQNQDFSRVTKPLSGMGWEETEGSWSVAPSLALEMPSCSQELSSLRTHPPCHGVEPNSRSSDLRIWDEACCLASSITDVLHQDAPWFIKILQNRECSQLPFSKLIIFPSVSRTSLHLATFLMWVTLPWAQIRWFLLRSRGRESQTHL